MSTSQQSTTGRAWGSRRALVQACLVLIGGLYPAAWVWGQDAGAQDVERSFYFVERLSDATDLYNSGKPAEAMAIFQELVTNYPALDEDGYAALGIGDCLVQLNRNDQARAAYAAALAAHPALNSRVADRLAELDVAEVNDESLDRLRAAAASGRAADLCRLGRGLQKRARDLLSEAVKTFRAAAESDSRELLPGVMRLTGQAAALDELTQDLSSLVDRAEWSWAAVLRGAQGQNPAARDAGGNADLIKERGRAEYLLRTQDGGRVEIQMNSASGIEGEQITVNGRPIELTEAEKRLIQHHQDRINAVLMGAAGRSGDKRTEGR
jgi:tetratricopeptide (TPR) repeat protein